MQRYHLLQRCLPISGGKTIRLFSLCFAVSISAPSLCLANIPGNSYPDYLQSEEFTAYAAQRETYIAASKAFDSGNINKFKQLSRQLKDYPLYPYLEYKAYNSKLSTLSQQQVQYFLKTYDETVVGDWLRSKLITTYSRKKRWQSLIDIYRPGYGVTAECNYLYALIKNKQASLAYPRIEALWLSPSSQPKQCDKVFSHWKKQGLLTPELIWERFRLAINDGNRSLAKYLFTLMSGGDRTAAQLWLKSHNRPQKVRFSEIRQLPQPEQSSLLVHWLKRLVRHDIDLGIETFLQHQNYPFTRQQHAQVTRYIGLKLARSHLPGAHLWLARVPAEETDKHVKEWKIRTAIRQGDWVQVVENINQLSTSQQNTNRWQYWWAYANEELGNNNDAIGIYQRLAEKRSYYGFLAADHLNLNYNFRDRPIEPSEDAISYIRQQPETTRAREFYLMERQLPARREWQRLLKRLTSEQKLAASKLAQLWGWHDRAIITMGQTRYRDDIELRFPLLMQEKIHKWSSRHNIEAAWTYAIIRRESAFISDARSSVGAMGLMQLMPNTARSMARHLNIHYSGYSSLLTTNTNIRLGTGYLDRMLEKLNLQVLATAAYNAGPHRVEAWLPEHRAMDAMRWIETIPFQETREYVSNVLAYMAIYEHRMQRTVTRLRDRMPPIPPKEASSDESAISQAVSLPNTPFSPPETSPLKEKS